MDVLEVLDFATANGVSRAMRPAAGLCVAVLLLSCVPPHQPKKLEMEPIGTLKNIPTTALDDRGDSGVTSPNSGTAPIDGACTSGAFDNVEVTLRQCEVPLPRASEVPSLKEKLEVKVSTSASTASPGGRVEVTVTLRNRTAEPLPLYFTGDPLPKFDLETVDAKGRRADLPAAKWPGYPKGYKPEARDAKASRITLEKNGTARVKLSWDAVKTRWAPDRARTWEGRGYPRVSGAALPPGKYSLRLVLPLLGAVDLPKTPIDVGS